MQQSSIDLIIGFLGSASIVLFSIIYVNIKEIKNDKR